jgi:hypothetical protein
MHITGWSCYADVLLAAGVVRTTSEREEILYCEQGNPYGSFMHTDARWTFPNGDVYAGWAGETEVLGVCAKRQEYIDQLAVTLASAGLTLSCGEFF